MSGHRQPELRELAHTLRVARCWLAYGDAGRHGADQPSQPVGQRTDANLNEGLEDERLNVDWFRTRSRSFCDLPMGYRHTSLHPPNGAGA